MKIVGRKIETFLTVQPLDYGCRLLVTKHAIVKDLHATKGWRTIARHKEEQTRKAPPARDEVEANTMTAYEARR